MKIVKIEILYNEDGTMGDVTYFVAGKDEPFSKNEFKGDTRLLLGDIEEAIYDLGELT